MEWTFSFRLLFPRFLLFADVIWSIETHIITLKSRSTYSKWPKLAGVLVHATKSLQSLVWRA